MLAGAGLGDDPGLAHAPRQQDLAQHVVDLVRAGVVQLVPLEIDLGAAQALGQTLGEIERARPADVVFPQVVHLVPETLVGLGLFVFLFQRQDQRHQRFRDEAAAVIAEAALFVGAGHEGIEKIVGHAAPRVGFAALNIAATPGRKAFVRRPLPRPSRARPGTSYRARGAGNGNGAPGGAPFQTLGPVRLRGSAVARTGRSRRPWRPCPPPA